MKRPHPADGVTPALPFSDTDPAHSGNNLFADIEVIRAAVHVCVDGLAACEVHALWAVLRPYVEHALVTELGFSPPQAAPCE